MAKIIYNEGRVVGLSAYEIYVQQFLAVNPNGTPATEREWLSASISSGTSIVLEVPASLGPGIVDIPLPTSSNLCAANTIIGSLFIGKLDSTGSHIDDYGPLISNKNGLSPTGIVNNINTTTVPPLSGQDYTDWMTNHKLLIAEYTRIVDGIIIQPGEWVNRGKPAANLPKMDFEPDLSGTPVVRLNITGTAPTITAIQLLLTGFTDSGIISGIAGLEGSTETNSPQNGDFLGPAVFPWANKIIFISPPTNPNLTNIPITITEDGGSYGSGVNMSSTTLSPSLANNDGTQITISQVPTGTITANTIYWAKLLEALAEDKRLDILGEYMQAVKLGLPGNYIQFPGGVRLYVSDSAPPTTGDYKPRNGDIGVGW